ncbi:MAG: hypothetical protein JWM71_1053, partial [Solirubrobacteraceae bacterium]|nr:hypothetical protein [Solirubrobacteraceae bacterium]
GCGVQAEAESPTLAKIRGNYTHDDTTVRGGSDQSSDYAHKYDYKMVVTISMANDYNGYIASYRDFVTHDHYRKALTGWGPHSSDFMATRLVELGHALKGDSAAQTAVDQETDPAVAAQKSPAWAPLAAKEIADQHQEDAKVQAVGEAADKATDAYAATLPDDGLGSPSDVKEPKDIQRFDAATFTWVGGDNYVDMPQVTVQRQVHGRWQTFADQSGEVPVSLQYPDSASCLKPGDIYGGDPTSGDTPNPDPSNIDPNCAAADAQGIAHGEADYRLGGQVWKWTATFEAMVNRFELVDPQGRAYQATPAGTYRFHVTGQRRAGGADQPYTIDSNSFSVAPWHGITVENARAHDGVVEFDAGPSHTVTEPHIRGSAMPDFGNLTFTIGAVDFPDHAADQKATGFRFLNAQRGYSASSKDNPADAEHYCLDCRFRDWLDATSDLTATVRFAGGAVRTVHTTDGHFSVPGSGAATIVIRDAWGDDNGTPVQVGG